MDTIGQTTLPRVAVQHTSIHADIIIYLNDDSLYETGRVTIGRSQDIRPGSGAYAGRMLHWLGHPVQYYDKVGDDFFGEYTVRTLAQWGHDVSTIERYNGDSMVCVSIVDKETLGGTMFLTCPPEWQQTYSEAAELILSAGPTPHLTYFWSWFWSYDHRSLAGTPTSELTALAAGNSSWVFLDPNWKPAGRPPDGELAELRRSLAYVNVFKPNTRDAYLLTGKESPLESARVLGELGPETVVVTDGENGCWVAGTDVGGVAHVPTPGTSVRDTTGAGDYFGGALLHSLAIGNGSVESAAFATAAASFAIGLDSGEVLADHDEVLELGCRLLSRADIQ